MSRRTRHTAPSRETVPTVRALYTATRRIKLTSGRVLLPGDTCTVDEVTPHLAWLLGRGALLGETPEQAGETPIEEPDGPSDPDLNTEEESDDPTE